MVVALGALMSSTFRYYSFKDIQWTEAAAIARGGSDCTADRREVLVSRPTLLAIAGAYTLHGVVLQVVRTVRHRLASRPALEHALRARNRANRVAIVVSFVLRGKEFKQVLEDRNFPTRKSFCSMRAWRRER